MAGAGAGHPRLVPPTPRAVLRGLGRSFPGRDLALWAAGATFFGLIGIVPLVMVSLWLAALLVGAGGVVAGVEAVIGGLPGGHGTPQALRTLTSTALDLSGVQAVVLLFPASLYGEGLRRALLQLAPGEADASTGWRGRAGLGAVVTVAPVLVLALLAAAPVIGPLYAAGGGRLLLGVVLGFHVVWVVVSVALVLVHRVVAAGRIGRRALLVGAFASGSVLAGFLQGFVLFLAIPVEWSSPFGGLPVVGAVAALALWLYLLHVLVLLGYRFTLVLDAMRPAAR